MQDRQPGAPGQYKAILTPAEFQKMQAGQQFTINMVRDDQPVVEGTPYSKSAVLPDNLASTLCPDILNPTPADAFRALYQIKAPSGYGSGEDPKVLASFSALDTLRVSGKYFVNAGAAGAITIDGLSIGYAQVDIIGKSDSVVIQRMNPYRTGYWLQRTVSYDGTIGPWEWENPPLVVGTEYRTTERFDDKTVYAKKVDCGILPDGTAATKHKDVWFASVIKDLVSLVVTARWKDTGWQYHFPIMNNSTGVCTCFACIVDKNIRLFTIGQNMAEYTAKATVKYTKE